MKNDYELENEYIIYYMKKHWGVTGAFLIYDYRQVILNKPEAKEWIAKHKLQQKKKIEDAG